MPTNGYADGILYTVNGAPAFTYGMITLTAVVLAYVTFVEAPDIPIESNPVTEVISTPVIPTLPFEEKSEESPVPSEPEPPVPSKPEPPVPSEPEPEPPVSPEPPVPSQQESSTLSEPEEKKTQGGKKPKKRKTRRVR